MPVGGLRKAKGSPFSWGVTPRWGIVLGGGEGEGPAGRMSGTWLVS